MNNEDKMRNKMEKVKKELIDMLGFSEDEIILTSAKEGIGIKELVETIIKKVPAPKGNKKDKLQALIFDSYYDAYRGIVLSVRVVNGTLKVGDTIRMMNNKATYEVNKATKVYSAIVAKDAQDNEYLVACLNTRAGATDILKNMNLDNLSVFSHKNNQGHVSRVVYIPGQDYIAATEANVEEDMGFDFSDFSAPVGFDFAEPTIDSMNTIEDAEGFDFSDFSEPVFV